jgi:hypothetical protein
MHTRKEKALIAGLSALLIAIWIAALWYNAGHELEAWEKAQEFNDFDR